MEYISSEFNVHTRTHPKSVCPMRYWACSAAAKVEYLIGPDRARQFTKADKCRQ